MLGLILLVQTLSVAIAGPPTSPEYLPVRVAEIESYFTREGLSVTVHSTRAESGAAEALVQGQADIVATSLEAMLRFGQRPGGPATKLVFGLTAAPPVSLLVHASHAERIRSPRDLAGTRVGLTSTGAPEQAWLMAVLTRAHVNPAQVDLRSFGARGVATALDADEIQAGFVPEPAATQLVGDGRARLLAGLTSPRAVAEAVGGPTVNAGVFVRADRRPGDREISAFVKALLAAERLLATEPAAALAARWPPTIVGVGDVFERRLETTRSIYLRDGLVSTDAVAHTVEIVRSHLPLPSTVRVPPPQQLLLLEPLKHALASRP